MKSLLIALFTMISAQSAFADCSALVGTYQNTKTPTTLEIKFDGVSTVTIIYFQTEGQFILSYIADGKRQKGDHDLTGNYYTAKCTADGLNIDADFDMADLRSEWTLKNGQLSNYVAMKPHPKQLSSQWNKK